MDDHVDYALALAEADVFLGRAADGCAADDLPAILAAWAAEGERLAYPTPGLDPERLAAR